MDSLSKLLLCSSLIASMHAMSPELRKDIVSRYVNADNTVTLPVQKLMKAGGLIDGQASAVTLDEAVEKTQAHWLHRNWDYENAILTDEEKEVGPALLDELNQQKDYSAKSTDIIMVLQTVLPSSLACLKKLGTVLAQAKEKGFSCSRIVCLRGNNPMHDEQAKNASCQVYHEAVQAMGEKIETSDFTDSIKPQNQEELVRFLVNNTSFKKLFNATQVEHVSVNELKKWAENNNSGAQKILLISPYGQRNHHAINFGQALENSSFQMIDVVQAESFPEHKFYQNNEKNYEYAYLRDAALTRVLFRIKQMQAK